MVTTKGVEKQTRERFQVAYVGDDEAKHTMDVEVLAPALLGFSKLIRAANAELNQNRAEMRVLVDSEFEHKCFLINFETVQTVLEHVQSFLNDEGVKKAGDVLQKLGVLGGTVATGVFGYLKWRNGKKIGSVQEVKDSPNSVIIKLEGTGNTLQLPKEVFQLAQNPNVLAAVEATLAPVEKDGEANAIEFRRDDKQLAVYRENDVKAIAASCENIAYDDAVNVIEDATRTVTAVLYAHGPVFDTKAPNWRFMYSASQFTPTSSQQISPRKQSSAADRS